MALQLTIKEQIPAKNKPINKCHLHVRSMQGDGDGYNQESFSFSPDDEKARELAYDVVRLLEAYAALDWNAQCDIAQIGKWEDLYTSTFGDEPAERTLDQIGDLAGYDPIYDQMAAPDSWHFTYYNDKGIEHNVEVTVDGKPMIGRR